MYTCKCNNKFAHDKEQSYDTTELAFLIIVKNVYFASRMVYFKDEVSLI